MADKIKSIYETVHELKEGKRSTIVENDKTPCPPPTEQWPRQPHTLELDRKNARLMLAYDVLLMIIPILLMFKIALVIIAWHFDRDHFGTELDHVSILTHFVIELNGQMVTIFTIVFVTVVATLVKRHALFKAQQGASLSELEQFQGSVSLPSTLKLIWSLRAWNRKSIGLVVIWAFQYLGSQSSKYEYRLTDSARFHTYTIAVRGPNTPSGFNPKTPSNGTWDINIMNGEFITAVNVWSSGMAAGDRLSTDLNGMALLPDLERLLSQVMSNGTNGTFTIKQDRHNWYDMSQQSRIAAFGAYTSARGAQFRFDSGNQERWLGEYVYSPNYLNVSCSAPTLQNFDAFPNGTLSTQSVSMNMTLQNSVKDAAGNALRSFELWLRWAKEAGKYNTSGSALSVCNITSVRVDFDVRCLSTGCIPKKMRWWNDTNQELSTSFKTPFDDNDFAANFFNNILLLEGQQQNLNIPTITSEQLCPHEVIHIIDAMNDTASYSPDIWNSDPTYFVPFHENLNLFFNTYYMISQEHMGILPNMDEIKSKGTDGNFDAASFKGAPYRPHYTIAWEWIAIDFLSCLVLLYAAVASLLFRTWTIAPDVLGNVSSLTRDNPYSNLPDNGTTLSGMERARMLRRVTVQLCDVSSPGEQNRIGFARVDTIKRPVAELRKTTAYV